MQYLSKEDIYKFQSTHPSWGATRAYKATFSRLFISIHAPIVGCDNDKMIQATFKSIISIHAPIVGCDQEKTEIVFYAIQAFQSTHPSWGATSPLFLGSFS